jgi:serine/threonine-protein kinase
LFVQVALSITAGPHAGKEFHFDRHETFLVGRAKDAHFRLSYDDPYFSRRHFLIEVNPPRCRVLDLGSRNGTYVNGEKVKLAELKDGDEVQAGHTVFRVRMVGPIGSSEMRALEAVAEGFSSTVDTPVGWHPPGYRLGTPIGEGAMGIVYRGRREADKLPVAIKLIKTMAGVGPRQSGRFLRETQILGQLQHPNIVRWVDSGEASGVLYLVMEWVDGPTLSKLVKERGALPVHVAVRMTCQLLSGLGHAHAAGYVHRDIKPSNVLVGGGKGKRVVKIADFGLARAYDAAQLSRLTMQGEIGGTPAYMAPEQVSHYRDVKPAADQYSAAATLYTLLTGRHVYDFNKDVADQLVQIVTTDPVPITQRRSDLPQGLSNAIMRALSRDTADRFADVNEFRAALLPFA